MIQKALPNDILQHQLFVEAAVDVETMTVIITAISIAMIIDSIVSDSVPKTAGSPAVLQTAVMPAANSLLISVPVPMIPKPFWVLKNKPEEQ